MRNRSHSGFSSQSRIPNPQSRVCLTPTPAATDTSLVTRAFVKSLVVAVMVGRAAMDGSPQQAPAPTFRSGRDILTIDAAVRNKRLGLWLPVKMTECHERQVRGARGGLGRMATATSVATDGDFKRFETSTSTKFQN
jgi:hypothetical protein